MEGRANCSPSYKFPDPMSRVQQDLNGHHSKKGSLDRAESNTMLRRSLLKGRKPSVCVVGAGIAGMRCAQVLGEKGINVTVLEARDRTGGRVGSGPNWIHGVNQNPILDLAKELKANTMPAPELPPSIYDHTGQLLGQGEGQKCSELMWGIIEEAFEYSNANSASIPQDQSLLDFFKLKLNEKDVPKSTQERVLQLPLDLRLTNAFLENLFLASTYKAILERITKDTYTHANVQLSTKVTSTTSQGSSVDPGQVYYSSIAVNTDQNQTSQYDEVVTTVPLGWLKRNKETFSPPLPTRLQTAINNLSYGRLEKVYLTFPSAFWLSSEGDTPAIAQSQTSLNPFFNQWLAPNYTSTHWPVECVFLSSLPSPSAHPTLLFYMHGPLAEHITTLVTPLNPSSPAYLSALDDFFKPYYSRLPNCTPSCSPIAALATNWTNDEFSGWGSYSNFQVSDPKDGQVELDKDIEALRYGVPDRRLWFAGEHTSPFVALGTVTGAWWSGEKVARRILEA
ncbi:MAG: hypothetical protein Q9170_008024, partial [Blastenia crenularia]